MKYRTPTNEITVRNLKSPCSYFLRIHAPTRTEIKVKFHMQNQPMMDPSNLPFSFDLVIFPLFPFL